MGVPGGVRLCRAALPGGVILASSSSSCWFGSVLSVRSAAACASVGVRLPLLFHLDPEPVPTLLRAPRGTPCGDGTPKIPGLRPSCPHRSQGTGCAVLVSGNLG